MTDPGGSTEAGAAAKSRARGRWFARCVVTLVEAMVVSCAVGYALGAEEHWPMSELQYLPYPVYLAPALVAVALSAGDGPDGFFGA